MNLNRAWDYVNGQDEKTITSMSRKRKQILVR
jgi:hypothetical protein